MQLNSFALLGALAFLSLPLSLPAQTSFVSVTSSKLTDATGAAANAQVCAQAVDPMGNAISVHVKGGGVTTTQQVCTNAVAGAWSLSLPNTLLTIPGNAGFNITATDNVSGSNLIGPGYTYVQPTSDLNSRWCTTTTAGLTTCNFDNLPPMVKPMVQTVYQGPAGKDGTVGPAGCVVGSTCAAVPLQQPAADQFSSNILYMAAVGNVPQKAMAAYALANSVGKGLSIVLTGGLAPVSSTDLVIPSGGFVNSFTCQNGSGLQYNGSGNAVLMGTASSTGLPNTIQGCTIKVATDTAVSGISTCAVNAGIFGVNILDNYVIPLDFSKFTASSTTAMIDLCGNVVAPYVHGNTTDRGLNSFLLRTSLGSFQSGSNGALLDHNVSANATGHGVYITPTSGAQNVTVRNHLDEGGGCLLPGTSGVATGSSIEVGYAQGSSFLDNYLEAGGCGKARMVVGGTGGTVDAVRIAGGTFQENASESDIVIQSGTNITVEPFTRSGSAGSNAVTVAANFTGYNVFLNMDPVNNLSATFDPEMNTGLRFTTTRYNDLFTSGMYSFPQGSCTPVFHKNLGTNYWQIAANGEWASSVGYIPVNAGKPVTSTNPTVSLAAGPLITFSLSNGVLCGTPAANTGTVSFHGSLAISGLTVAPTY